MNFNDYQKQARKTAFYPDKGKSIIYPTLAMAGEVGEFANKVKKIWRDDNGKITKDKKEELIAELGDILWFISQLATELKVPLEEMADHNLQKLQSRLKRKTFRGSGDYR